MDNAMTPADVAAIAGNDGAFGGWTGLIALLIIVSMFGGGFGFGNRGDFGQYATAASQNQILFGQQFQNLDNKMDRLGNGIADAAYALRDSIGGVGTQVLDAKYDNALRIDNLGAQMQSCCCENKMGIMENRYLNSQEHAALQANINDKFAALEKGQLEQTINAQAARIQSLELQAAMCGVPRISTYAYGITPQFACGCNGYYGGTTF